MPVDGSLTTRADCSIRSYLPEDEADIRRICCDTGFWGKPIDEIFNDRELFADLIVSPYLKQEPEHTLVAVHDMQVVGYLLGSLDASFERKALPTAAMTVAKMLWRSVTGRYADHPRSKAFVWWVLTKALVQSPKHPDNAAHLHINLEKPFRDGSLSYRLLDQYEQMLRAEKISHYYGQVFSSDTRRSGAVYEKLGFEIFDRVETAIFWPEIEKLFHMCIHKRI